MKQRNSQSYSGGFAMIELMVMMVVGVIMAVGLARGLQTSVNLKRSDATAGSIQLVLDAATAYLEDERDWPDEDDDGVNAISVLRSNNYLAGVNSTTAWNQPNSNIGEMRTACGELTGESSSGPSPLFYIQLPLTQEKWADYIASSLSAATVSPNFRVTAYAARSQIFSGREDLIVKDMLYARTRDYVQKPDCPPGYAPEIFGSNAGFASNYRAPPVGAVFVSIMSETSTRWRVRMRVSAEGEYASPTPIYTSIQVTTACRRGAEDDNNGNTDFPAV